MNNFRSIVRKVPDVKLLLIMLTMENSEVPFLSPSLNISAQISTGLLKKMNTTKQHVALCGFYIITACYSYVV